jgi:hypothetical protein
MTIVEYSEPGARGKAILLARTEDENTGQYYYTLNFYEGTHLDSTKRFKSTAQAQIQALKLAWKLGLERIES